MFSRVDGESGAYILLDTTAGGHGIPYMHLLVGSGLILVCILNPSPSSIGLAILGVTALLMAAMLFFSPARFHALGADGLYEYVKHLGKARVGRHLARREDILGVAVVVAGNPGGAAAWAPALHIRGLKPITFQRPDRREEAEDAATRAAEELGVPRLEETPPPENATVVQPGNLVAVQLDSDLETWVTWGAFGFLTLSFIPGCIWLVMQGGLAGSSAVFGKVALSMLGPSLVLFLIRGQLEDFIVLDLGTRRLIFIRRFAGYESQKVLASLDAVREAAVMKRLDQGKGGAIHFYRPILRLDGGRHYFVGELTDNPVEAHERAEDMARKIGCRYRSEEDDLSWIWGGFHPFYAVMLGFGALYLAWLLWGVG